MSRSDHHSDYEAGQLVLFGLASIVVLAFRGLSSPTNGRSPASGPLIVLFPKCEYGSQRYSSARQQIAHFVTAGTAANFAFSQSRKYRNASSLRSAHRRRH